MKVHELKAIIDRLPQGDELVIGVKTLRGAVGGHPYVKITGAYPGSDWDKGKTFLGTETDVAEIGESYNAERKLSRDRGEGLAFIWMAMASKSLDPKQKNNAVRQTLKRFGFDRGLEDDAP